MKANKKARENDDGAASVVGTILMLPIAMVIISAILLWSSQTISHIYRVEQQSNQNVYNFMNTNITYTSKSSNSEYKIIWEDDFEKEFLTWDEILQHAHSFVKPNHKEHYNTKGHSAAIYTGDDPSDAYSEAGIEKPFHGERYESVSIEIAFTISPLEDYKIFSISQNNVYNKGEIKITFDHINDKIKFEVLNEGTPHTFYTGKLPCIDDYCWHHMQLIVDFEPANSIKAHYVSFKFDNEECNLTKYNLTNTDHLISQNPQTINVNYISVEDEGNNATTYIDDFIIKTPFKEENYNLVNIPPIASFTYNPLNPTTSDNVQFTDTSTDSDGVIVNWDWDFGDGTTSILQNPTHNYATNGFKTVTLTVSDNDGETDSTTQIINVGAAALSTWIKDHAVSGSGGHYPSTVIQTSDGGYAEIGSRLVSGNYTFLIIKLDANADVEWAKEYELNKDERIMYSAQSIQQTSDGGFIVTGRTGSYSANLIPYILKLDSVGDIEWFKTYGNMGAGWAINQTSDGGYVLAGRDGGSAQGEFLILKIDSSGNKQWAKTWGDATTSLTASSIQQASDGGYLIAGHGYSDGIGSNDIVVLKLDSTGNQEWAKQYEDATWPVIKITSDGGAIVSASTPCGGGACSQANFLILKIDSNGNQEWAKEWGRNQSSPDMDEAAFDIKQTSDDGYILSGRSTRPSGNERQGAILKLDSTGNQEWARYIDINGDGYTHTFHSIIQCSDGGYVSIAPINYNLGNIKLDQNGDCSGCPYISIESTNLIKDISTDLSADVPENYIADSADFLTDRNLNVIDQTGNIETNTYCLG